MVALAEAEQSRIVFLDLARVEFRSALRRREREGNLDAADVGEVLRRFEEHVGADFLIQPMTTRVIEEALQLLDRHSLRAYDAVQLAGARVFAALDADKTIFVCSDLALIEAADAEGFEVVNPEATTP